MDRSGNKKITYPVLSKEEKRKILIGINIEKKSLAKKIKSLKKNNILSEYIFTLLKIENILVPHINKIELYYVQLAKNMYKMLISLRRFFK